MQQYDNYKFFADPDTTEFAIREAKKLNNKTFFSTLSAMKRPV